MVNQRWQIVLAAMAAGGSQARYDAVRLQKLLFLIDREAAGVLDGPFFDFRPYHYGPFNKEVYDEVEALAIRSYVQKDTSGHYVHYVLTRKGYAAGTVILTHLPEPASQYMRDVAKWLLSVSFQQLLWEVYRRYPDMATNSVIRFMRRPYTAAEYGFSMPSFVSGMARTLDIMGELDEYPMETDSQHRDLMALYNDWRTVGNDLRTAIARVADHVRTP